MVRGARQNVIIYVKDDKLDKRHDDVKEKG